MIIKIKESIRMLLIFFIHSYSFSTDKETSKSKVPKNITQLKNKKFFLTVALSKKAVQEKALKVYGAKLLKVEDHTSPSTSHH